MVISGLKLTCVYEVQQNLKDPCFHSEDLHFLLIRFAHSSGEQSREERAASSKNQTVDSEDPTPNLQPHITEVSTEPHLVDLGQDESGIAV